MKNEHQISNRIYEAAIMLFSKRGFRAVSMDDLAKETGMSKKTIYKYIGTKAELIEKLVVKHLESEVQMIGEIVRTNEHPILAMVKISRLLFDYYKEMSPDLLIELKKYYYKIWLLIDKTQQQFTLDGVLKNIQNGMKLGLYRSEIDAEYIANVYVNNMITACDREVPTKGIEFYYMMLFEYHMYGIMTEKGHVMFEKYKAQLSK